MDQIDFIHDLSPPPHQLTFSDEDLHDSARNSSGPDEAVFDNLHDLPQHDSPHTSDDDISLLPSTRAPSCTYDNHVSPSPYTPNTTRSPFRNPSSVRAIQLDTTPPHLMSSSQRYKLHTPTRNSTPRSTRSYHSTARSPSRLSPAKKEKVVKEHPLVLLHVTILPIVAPYSQEVLESVLPGYVLENWKLLREKVTDTMLERGVLVPHPREDYDLLEERLLESLELQVPRILKCGHFHLEGGDEEEVEEEEGYESGNDADICDDCGRRIRDGRFGSGTGSKRWEIHIYAANGLMRAGAWGAAWREMERVDVEILPWVEDSVRRELDLRREEEMRTREEEMKSAAPEHYVDASIHEELGHDLGRGGIDVERMREIYGEGAQAYIDGLQEEPTVNRPRERKRRRRGQDVELWLLLKNYVHLMLQDRRNVAILLLSLLVAFLSLGGTGKPSRGILLPIPEIPSTPSVSSSVASFAQPSLSTTIPTVLDPVRSYIEEKSCSTVLASSLTTAATSLDVTTSETPFILEGGVETEAPILGSGVEPEVLTMEAGVETAAPTVDSTAGVEEL
ncbi:hypothetical protein MMC30_007985 [Trapelia coarctata]|nr:hypothetical protein [Trapelia coarctata]